MNQISIKSNVTTLSSIEVAEMIGKEHKFLLRDIRTYINQINEANKKMGASLNPCDYFIESTYLDEYKRTKPCYELTKLGCELTANKLTGVKGTAFTATYTKKFNEMQQQLQSQIPQVVQDYLNMSDTDKGLAYFTQLKKFETLEADKKLLEQKLHKRSLKEETFDKFLNADGIDDMGVTAKKLGTSRNKLFAFLRLHNVLMSTTDDWNIPYQKYLNAGYFMVKTQEKNGHIYNTTYVTAKGLIWLEKVLKKYPIQ